MFEITYKQITDAVNEKCEHKNFTISAVGTIAKIIERNVNKRIDSHLEACFIKERGDSFEWKDRRLECVISAESMPVFLRRLTEDNSLVDTEEESLASDILSTLDIESDTGCFRIVKQ